MSKATEYVLGGVHSVLTGVFITAAIYGLASFGNDAKEIEEKYPDISAEAIEDIDHEIKWTAALTAGLVAAGATYKPRKP